EWAGKPFRLLEWQEQIIRDIFGVIKPNGKRQFTHCFVEICKKSGKSELAAAIALYLLFADGEYGAQLFSVANDTKQAELVFNMAVSMIRRQPALLKRCKIVPSASRIVFPETESYYAAVSKEVATKFGTNAHAVIFDELLGQTNRELYDTMTLGANSARKQPLNFVITTAGNDRQSICYEEHCTATDILSGKYHDSTYYPVVFSVPDDADWQSPETWHKANPSLGKIVDEEYYTNFCESAKHNPAKELYFRQFFLCQWTTSVKRWLPMEKYAKCGKPFDVADLHGRVAYGGLDLASTNDIAAFVLVFPPRIKDGERGEYFVLPHFWIPEENMKQRVKKDRVSYDKWVRDGFLEATEGNIIYYDFIEKKITELSKIYEIREIAYDRWGSIQMCQNLEREDFEMVEFGQGFKSMSQPSKELYRLVIDERLRHNGHPVLEWMFENVHIETDAAANIKPTKIKSKDKIDGVVATVMALDRAIKRNKKPRGGLVSFNIHTGQMLRNGVPISEEEEDEY
ncbi:MAG: terminase large subunit, partial [Oscillospiraceae bacterium]|nr:terminase large subunit [Oscillospiraceae bacterium]